MQSGSDVLGRAISNNEPGRNRWGCELESVTNAHHCSTAPLDDSVDCRRPDSFSASACCMGATGATAACLLMSVPAAWAALALPTAAALGLAGLWDADKSRSSSSICVGSARLGGVASRCGEASGKACSMRARGAGGVMQCLCLDPWNAVIDQIDGD
jgi:hypothetical protein